MDVIHIALGAAFWARVAGMARGCESLRRRRSVRQPHAGRRQHGRQGDALRRRGVAASALFATITIDASCGAVNTMHDSFTPFGGLVPLVDTQPGEVVFGAGTMPCHGPLFGSLLIGVVLLVGLLNYVPALAPGPVIEHLQLWK